MKRLVALALVLAAGTALAYDSRCYDGNGSACHAGPDSARQRWIGPSDEHRQLWEKTVALSGVTALSSSEFMLQVFTKDDIVPDGTGAQVPTLTPVRFADAERAPSRTMTPSEFAQLPDFGYSLFDWATGFETCPLDAALPGPAPLDACHDFSTHMGAVNSNHFLPQAQAFYVQYHRLALDRAAACKTMKDRIVARGGQVTAFDEFVRACEQEAFVLEAIGHHYLQDAWSTGHMWERWGSPDLLDFTDLPQSLLIAMTSGLIHGARGVLQDAIGFAGFDVNDPLCAPGALVRFVPGPINAPVVGLGDLFLGQLLDHAGAAFSAQYFQLFSCAATSLRQVQRAMGDGPGPLDMSLIEVADPTGSDCFGQRATNAAMVDGIGLDFTDPAGIPHRIELDSVAATQLVASASAAIGGSAQNVNPILQASYAFDMARIVTHARLRGFAEPDATDLASGGLGPLLGIDRNGAFVQQPLAPYVDPPLPWPDSPTGANGAADRALALARTFHAGHAIDWCNRFRAGAPDGSDVDLLRAHVHVVQAAGTGGSDLAAACLACETFAARHLRVGTDAANYDTSREPLCFHVADDPVQAQYVFQPGTPSDTVTELATTYCGCGSSTTTTTTSSTTTTTLIGLTVQVTAGDVQASAGAELSSNFQTFNLLPAPFDHQTGAPAHASVAQSFATPDMQAQVVLSASADIEISPQTPGAEAVVTGTVGATSGDGVVYFANAGGCSGTSAQADFAFRVTSSDPNADLSFTFEGTVNNSADPGDANGIDVTHALSSLQTFVAPEIRVTTISGTDTVPFSQTGRFTGSLTVGFLMQAIAETDGCPAGPLSVNLSTGASATFTLHVFPTGAASP